MPVINPSRSILVFLAGGVQGAAVVRAALRHGFQVLALVRQPERAIALRLPGVELIQGDLSDTASLRIASRGVDHVVLQVPTGSVDGMRTQAANALAALTAERVPSLVLKLASASRPASCTEPSFVANAMVEDAVRRSGIPFAIVRPTMYLDNLLKPSARAEIVNQGVFAPPIVATQRIAWTSADDCAEAAIMLLERGVDGRDHRIAGPESLSGDALAARITSGLGRPVAYRAQPIEAFEREVDVAMGAGAGRRIASKFRYFAAHPDETEDILARPFDTRVDLKGFIPTDIKTWVRGNRSAFLDDAPPVPPS